jgi:hypothetical protein
MHFNTVQAVEGGLQVQWRTGSERQTAGFNIYRSGPGETPRRRLNPHLIPARGSATRGETYAVRDSALVPNVGYLYWLEEVELTGATRLYGPAPGSWLLRYALRPAYPSPFAGSTVIRFDVLAASPVSVRIYDITGRLVRELAEGRFAIGTHTLAWDGRDSQGHAVPSGIYLTKMVAGKFTESKKVVVLR